MANDTDARARGFLPDHFCRTRVNSNTFVEFGFDAGGLGIVRVQQGDVVVEGNSAWWSAVCDAVQRAQSFVRDTGDD